MGRIIKTESAGKDRNKYAKEISLCIRELFKQTSIDNSAKDKVAYVVLALREIESSIDVSVAAWEKRGYWVKADRFRLDWNWTGKAARDLDFALRNDDWANIAAACTKIAGHFTNITITKGHRLGEPWVGAFEQLKKITT